MIQKNERLKTKFAPIVVITVIFVYMLVINSYMPMMADDYRYAMNWGADTSFKRDSGDCGISISSLYGMGRQEYSTFYSTTHAFSR